MSLPRNSAAGACPVRRQKPFTRPYYRCGVSEMQRRLRDRENRTIASDSVGPLGGESGDASLRMRHRRKPADQPGLIIDFAKRHLYRSHQPRRSVRPGCAHGASREGRARRGLNRPAAVPKSAARRTPTTGGPVGSFGSSGEVTECRRRRAVNSEASAAVGCGAVPVSVSRPLESVRRRAGGRESCPLFSFSGGRRG